MEIYTPKNANKSKVKNLIIAAHKDDGEMIGIRAIKDGLMGDGSVVMIVLTDGGGCPKIGDYADLSYDDMVELRTSEEKRASEIGHYNRLYLLEHSSKEVVSLKDDVIDELANLLVDYSNLETIYIHNPFDSHRTHVAALKTAILALRRIQSKFDIEKVIYEGGLNYVPPKKVIGVELWRDLDWLPNNLKVVIDTSDCAELSNEIMSVFTSQNTAKNYDVAIQARRLSNATFFESHIENEMNSLMYGINLTNFIFSTKSSLKSFASKVLKKFESELNKNF